MAKKKVFKIVLGQLPGCDKNCFTGFVSDDKNTYKDGGMYDGFVKQFNKSNWQQAGYTAKEFKEKSDMVAKVFKDEYKKASEGDKEVTADACFDVEVWPLNEAESMMNLLQAAEKEGSGEKEIVDIFNEVVKKLQRTNEDVKKNNPRKKYNLAETSAPNKEHGADEINKNKRVLSDKDAETDIKKETVGGGGEQEKLEIKEDNAVSETVVSLKERIGIVMKDLEAMTKEKEASEIKWQLIVKSKDKIIDSLTRTVQEREEEAVEKEKHNNNLEDKLRLMSQKEKGDSSDEEGLEEIRDDISKIKDGVEKLLGHMGEDVHKENGAKRKLADVLGDMEKFMSKNLKKSAVDDVKSKIGDNSKKVDKLSISVQNATEIIEKIATEGNEKYDTIVALIKDLEISAGSSNTPYKHLTPIYMSVEKTDKVAVIGDVILHHLMNDNPVFRYDLMFGAFVQTDFSCHKKDLVRMGSSLGLWMEKVPADTETIILSFGLNDVLAHPDVDLQRKQTSSPNKTLLIKQNKPAIASLAEKFIDAIKIVKQSFPKARILYVLPPPSGSESLVVDLLREEMKAAWQKDIITSDENSNVSLCDSGECLDSGSGTAAEVSIPGHLPWLAAVKLARKIYGWIFPDSSNRFKDCCSSIHIEGTCNKDCFGQTEPAFGSNGACRICNAKGHAARRCDAREFLKSQKIHCGHCGSLNQLMTHHPDICRERFSKCKLCNMYGHGTEVHQSPVPLKIAANRLGKHGLPFNKLDPKFDKSGGATIAECVEIKDDDPLNRGPPAKKAKKEERK